MSAQLRRAIQCYTARTAITSFSMRGAGSAGVVRAASEYLAKLPLQPFGTSKRAQFAKYLDETTDALLGQMPVKSRHWGLARKGLNIFLRGCLYTTYLRDHYALALSEEFFELPLDRITGTRLASESKVKLPSWTTVRGLDPDASAVYQAAALKVAKREGVARVHLDAMWWGERQE